jgi:TolB-like protein
MLLVTLGLGQSSAHAAEKSRVVMLNVNASTPKLDTLASAVTEQVMTELNETGRIDVVGSSDLAAVLGMERQRQLLGCSEQSTTCLAELSSALGAPWLVLGTLSQAGKALRLDLKLIRADDGKAVWRSGKSLKDEGVVFDAVSGLVKGLVEALKPPTIAELAAAKPPPPLVAPPVITAQVAPVPATGTPVGAADPRVAPRALVITGSSVLGVGALAFGLGSWLFGSVPTDYSGSSTTAADVALREFGVNLLHVSGIIAGSLGLVGLVTGLVWWARLPVAANMALTPTPQGLLLSGTL